MKRKLFFLVCLVMTNIAAFSQADVHFSQFYETSILRNPGLTGVFSDNYKIGVYYRNQWSSITNPYQTVMVNGEYRLSLGRNSYDFLSLGILGYSDQAGDLNQRITGIYPAINYNKSVNPNNNSYLSLGFVYGFLQYSFDPSKATFNNQFQGGIFDPSSPSMENFSQTKMNLNDVGVGLNYNFSAGPSQEATYMIGVSGYHFTQPVFSYFNSFNYKQNIRWNANAGMVRSMNDHILFQLHINYALQGTYEELIGGGLVGWRSFEAFSETSFEIYAGAFYRVSDAIVPVIKLRYKQASLGISYDINVSSLREASNTQGGLEITAFFTGDYPPSRGGTYKKTVCPRFN
jgi:type IX secretion system PorP/SprF family membrane protein